MFAHAHSEAQIYFPGIQYRYEEGSDQLKDVRDYSHYAIHYMYDRYLLGIEYNSFEDSTGNSSLSVKNKTAEWNAVAGFGLVKFDFKEVSENTNIEIFVTGYLGQNKSVIRTSLLGSSQNDESEEQSVVGVGGLVALRVEYFIAALDTRWFQSQAFEPTAVSVSTFKIGVNFKF
jgi:hypothetical protein